MKGQGAGNKNSSAAVGLEAVGTSMRTPLQSKQKENVNYQASSKHPNPFAVNTKSKQTPPNPYIVQHDERGVSGLGIVGKRLEDAKSTKELLQKTGTHIFNESGYVEDDEYIREAKEFEEKHVVKRVTKSGGFKIPEEYFEKPKQRKKPPKPADAPLKPNQKEFDDTRNEAGMSKLQILQHLGIHDHDEGLAYDRLQDRIYDNKLDEGLSGIVEDQVFDRLDQIHQIRDNLIKTKEQMKKNKEKEDKMKQENWDRLVGNQKFKPKYTDSKNEIEEEEFEESNNLEREVEEYYTKKYNLELSDRLRKEKEDEDEMHKSYKDRFFDDKNRFAKKKELSSSIDDQTKKFFDAMDGMEKPTLEETEHTLEQISKKNHYIRKQIMKSKGIQVSDSDEEEEELGIRLEAEKHKLSQLEDKSPRKQLYKSPSRFPDKSPLNIQSTVSHGFRSPRGAGDKLKVSIKDNFDPHSSEIHHSQSIESKLMNGPKFQNPYRREDSLNKQDNRSKSPFDYQNTSHQQQHSSERPPAIDPETRDYEKWEKEFKSYVQDRKKRGQVTHLEKSLEKKDFELYESTSPNKVRWEKRPTTNLAKSYDKKQSPDGKDLNNSKGDINQQNKFQELKMIQTMFDKIDKDQTGLIDKLDSVKYLIKQKQLMSIYDLTSQNLNKHVQQFPTEKKGYFKYEEFVKFLQTPRNILEKSTTSGNYFYDEIKKNRKKNVKPTLQSQGLIEDEVAELNENNSTCLLQAEHLRIMRELYVDLDKHNDMIVSRKQYIEKLRSDVRIVKILHLPALYMPSIDKTMIVDRVLYRIEQEQFIGDPDTKSTKEYITWQQFLEYFNDIKSLKKGNETHTQEKIKQIKVYSTIRDNVDDQNEIDLEEGIKVMLTEEYNKMPKQSEVYVNSFQFTEAVKMNNKYPQFANSLSRRKADKFDLKDELLCDTLDRMEGECDEYIDFEEIMEYFTRRGRPRYVNKKEEDKEFKEKLATVPRQKDNENMFNSKMQEKKEHQMIHDSSFKQSLNNSNYAAEEDQVEEIDGYDSDPETHIYRRGYQPDRKNLSRPKSALNRSFQRSKSQGKEGQSSEMKGLSQSITKSFIVDKRNNNRSSQEVDSDHHQNAHTSEEDAYYSSAKVSRKKNNKYYSDSDEFNHRDEIYDDEAGHHPDEQHIRIGGLRKTNNYMDEPEQHFNPNKNLTEQRGDYKKAMLDYYAGEVSKEKKFKLTKPEPYEFDEREKDKKKSKTIRQRKVEEMVEEVREKERKEYETRPKPKEIPEHVKKPLYEKIMHEQEKRRQEVRVNSVAITIQREKPFKFYIRDKNPETSLQLKKSKRKNKDERDKFVFTANKVPWFCSINLLEKINRDEELKRQERVAKQAQKTMAMSKLPPRMEKHEQERRARELMEGYTGVSKVSHMNPIKRDMYEEPSFQPPKAKAIPNFNKMHHDFQERLDKQRRGKRPTEVQPFNFQESRKLPPRDYMDQENELMRLTKTKPVVDKMQEAMKWRDHKPKYQPPSIKKWEQNVERNKKEKEDKEKKKEEEKKKEIERKKKTQEMAVVVKEKYSKNDQTIKLDQTRKEAVKKKKQEFKQQEQDWQQKKAEMLERVKNKPLLMESKCRGRAYLEKLKTLDKIDNRLKERGMNSKERQRMYTKEELLMLKEIKALKARGFKSFRNELDVGDDVSLSPPREGEDYDELQREFGDDDDLLDDSKKKTKKKDTESFLNKNINSSPKQELSDHQLSQLQELAGISEDPDDSQPISKPKSSSQQKPFNKIAAIAKKTDSISSMPLDDSYNEKKKDDSFTKKDDSFMKRDDSFSTNKDTKKPSFLQTKDTSMDKKSESTKSFLNKEEPHHPFKKQDKKSPILTPTPTVDQKKEQLAKMRFDSLESDKEDKYEADFE